MTKLCRFCFFSKSAERCHAKAKEWDDQKLGSLAGSWVKAAADLEGLAYGEKRCRCGEPEPEKAKRPRQKLDPEADWSDFDPATPK